MTTTTKKKTTTKKNTSTNAAATTAATVMMIEEEEEEDNRNKEEEEEEEEEEELVIRSVIDDHPPLPVVVTTTTTHDTNTEDTTNHHHTPPSSKTKKDPTITTILPQVSWFLRHEWYLESPYITGGMISMVLSSYINQMLPPTIGRFIDRSTSTTTSSTTTTSIYTSLGMMIVLGTFASCVRTMTLQIAAQHITTRLQHHLYRALLLRGVGGGGEAMVPTTSEEKNVVTTEITTTSTTTTPPTITHTPSPPPSPSYMISVLTNDIEPIAEMITSNFVNTIRSVSATVLSLYHMVLISPPLVMTTITIVPTLGVGTLFLNRYIKRAMRQQLHVKEQCRVYLEERLHHIPMIHQYDRTNDEIQYHARQQLQQHSYYAALLNGIRMGFMFGSGSMTLLYIIHCGTTTTTVRNSRRPNPSTPELLSGGQLTTFTTYALLFGLGCTGLMKSHQERQQIYMGPLQRYMNLLFYDYHSQNQNHHHATTSTTNTDHKDDVVILTTDTSSSSQHDTIISDIHFDAVLSLDVNNISFSYPSSVPTTSWPEPTTNGTMTTTTTNSVTTDQQHDGMAALQNIHLTIPKGKVVALVGPNGAGKSTLVQVVLGESLPTTGSIQVVIQEKEEDDDDNNNGGTTTTDPTTTMTTTTKTTTTTKRYSLRGNSDTSTSDQHHPTIVLPPRIQNQLVQVVTQTTYLFNMSIYDNVHYSNKYATEQDVIDALHDADCYDWVTTQKVDGIHTMVGRNGNLLSGGEQQKIGLARALLNNPYFLILDEPTSHIDQNSNTKISKHILRRRRSPRKLCAPSHDDNHPPSRGTQNGTEDDVEYEPRGILLITHDVKTILEYQVDYVYVMKHGRIVEHNTLDVLRSNRDSELCQLMPKLYHLPQKPP